ncbi:uncharacterized protein LOC144007855 isoform X1 [Festucalex cinctus]
MRLWVFLFCFVFFFFFLPLHSQFPVVTCRLCCGTVREAPGTTGRGSSWHKSNFCGLIGGLSKMGRGKEQLHTSNQESQFGSPAYNLSAESVNDGQQLLNSSAQIEDGFCFAWWRRHKAEPADEGAGVEGKVLLPGVDLQDFWRNQIW